MHRCAALRDCLQCCAAVCFNNGLVVVQISAALSNRAVPQCCAAVCFPSCPRRHSARLLRAWCTHLLRSATCLMPGAHLASFPGSLRRTRTCTASCPQAMRSKPKHWAGMLLRPTCFVSDPMKVRRAIDPASHRLPPPRLLSIVLRRRLATQRLAQPLGTHALFAPATTLAAPRESWHSSTQFPRMPSQLAPYPSACGFGRLGTLEPGPAAALYADYSSSPAAHVLPAPRCA